MNEDLHLNQYPKNPARREYYILVLNSMVSYAYGMHGILVLEISWNSTRI